MKRKTWKRKWLYNNKTHSYVTVPKLKMWNGKGYKKGEWIYVVNYTEQWAAKSLNEYYKIKESDERKYTTQFIQHCFFRANFNIALFAEIMIRKPCIYILSEKLSVDIKKTDMSHLKLGKVH